MSRNHAQKKRLSATEWYLFSALTVLAPTLFGAGFALDSWRSGILFDPASLAFVHALALGVLLTTAFGVLYQFVPIAFVAPPVPRRIVYWHLPAHLASVALMVAGFLLQDYGVVGVGGALLTANAAAYAAVLFQSYRRARNRTSVRSLLSVPVAFFALVVAVGLWMAFGLPGANDGTMYSHALLGAVGFWIGLVMVISYKFLPMFLLSHGYKSSIRWSVVPHAAGILAAAASPLLGPASGAVRFLGSALAVFGIVHLLVDTWRILRARKRKRVVLPLRYALAALLASAAASVWLLIDFAWRTAFLLGPAAYLLAFGGLVPMVLAYMQKIVPFLWFEYRFSQRPERKTAPSIDDMVPKIPAAAGVSLYYAGAAAGLASLILRAGGHWLGLSVSVLTAGGEALLAFSLARVLTIGGPRPQDDPPASKISTPGADGSG